MKLNDIFENFPEIEFSDICIDSRKVTKGSLFFAVTGTKFKGSDFIAEAINNGAAVIIGDEDLSGLNIPYFKSNNIRKDIALAASKLYSKKPQYIVAVTGTNGKTSIVSFCDQLFKHFGLKSATIGTLGVVSEDYNYDFGTTTPDAVEFHKTLQTLSENGVQAVAFEASSHGLDQHRIDYTTLNAAGFTNLTRDHLDYHKDMGNYFQAKKLLFTNILSQDGTAVLNADIDIFNKLTNINRKIISYGFKGKDLKLLAINGRGISLEAFGKIYEIKTNLIGDFQIMNALCAAGMIISCGFDIDKVINAISILNPPHGRLDFAGATPNGAEIYVDYAHTPDALENAIKALRPHTKNQLAVLFGCGGDRDKGKRPLMGKAAEDLADIVYVTDDNPRTEDSTTIRKEVIAGCPNKGIDAGDRVSAIKTAIANLKKGDILLLAGKGHEDYQIIGTTKHHLDDKEETIKAINNLKG